MFQKTHQVPKQSHHTSLSHMSYSMSVLLTRRHGICTCSSVCTAGSNGIVCNLESSFNLMTSRVQVEEPQTCITSWEILMTSRVEVEVSQASITSQEHWNRAESHTFVTTVVEKTRWTTTHETFIISFVQTVCDCRIRSSAHDVSMALGGYTHTSNCYPNSFPWPHSKVNKTSARHARSSHRHCSPWFGVFMVPSPFSFLVVYFPCHHRFSKVWNKFWFLYLKRFAGLFRDRNFWDTRFLRVIKKLHFLWWMYLE